MSDRSDYSARKYGWRDIERTAPPKRAAEERTADYDEIYSLYNEATVREQASRCIQCPHPLCMEGCPLSNRIPEWLALTAEGRFLEAAELSRSTSSMPEICPRICPQDRLCEGACILNACSEPVAIGAIEKFINEYAFAHCAVPVTPPPPNGRRVAVAGSGPAGMACADQLVGLGYAVTVFEAQDRPGGLLVNGIPSFKLEKEVVNRRLDVLRARGVEFKLGLRIGRDLLLPDMLKSFDAVFLGFGAQKAKPLRIPGADLPGVHAALPFLIEKNVTNSGLTPIPVQGRRVTVLGGGDTAMDCLRTAVRAGASQAICLYRRDEANMPGSRREYANALEEGAQFQFLTNPVALTGNPDGQVTAVRCVRMELGEPDAGGRRQPVPIPDSEFDVPADVVLIAYGFDPETLPVGSGLEGIELDRWKAVKVDENQMTSLRGVFAGGDLSRGASLVVHAVLDGRRAAHAIHRYLESKPVKA
jgi:glutamate synthase (NADPH) small chain